MKNGKSITLVSNNYWTLYKFRYEVIEMFLNEGYMINLIGQNDSYSDKFNHNNIKKYYIPIKSRSLSILDELRTFISLYKIYKSLKTNLIFHFTIKPNIYGSLICRLLNIKSISFITGIGHTFIRNNILQKFIVTLYKIALSKVYEIWFTNDSDKILFESLGIIKSNKTRVVPGSGINIPSSIRSYQHNSRTTFLMIARLQKEKGVIEFLECSEHYKNNPDISFILIGDLLANDPSGITIEEINKYIHNKSITYMSYQEDIYKHINEASCVVLPSYREGMSTVLLEASVLKRPIITTNVPGCIDIIKDESYGILCEPRNSSSLIDATQKFLNLDHLEVVNLVEKTFKHVKDNFSKNIVLAEYKNTINNL